MQLQSGHRAVFDVDGVLLDFYGGAAHILEEMLGRRMVKVDDRPATRHRYGLTDAEYQQMRVVMRTHAHGWANLPVLPGAVEAIQRVMAAGLEVSFLSSCGQSLFELRRANLDALGLSACGLVCVEDADKNAKGQVLARLQPVVFVDDHMKMLAQAPLVPERVWIDHGCSLELDHDGVPLIERHQVERKTSIASWVEPFLARLASRSPPDACDFALTRRRTAPAA